VHHFIFFFGLASLVPLSREHIALLGLASLIFTAYGVLVACSSVMLKTKVP